MCYECIILGVVPAAPPAPQNEVPWRCRHDGWINHASEQRCSYKGNPSKPENAGKQACYQDKTTAALPQGQSFNAWDWVGNVCQDNFNKVIANKAVRPDCHACGCQRSWLEKNFKVKLRNECSPATLFDSDFPTGRFQM